MYQAVIHTKYLIVDTFIVNLDLLMEFDDSKKNTDYHQTCPLTL